MENLDVKKPIYSSMVVDKRSAKQILKANNYKVLNDDIDAFVSLKDINKIYPNGVQAVYDFNIDVKKNDFIVLVGPSGCGKSTTLRMIAGLEDITSGYLYIDKVLSNYLSSKDRDISMVFQSYALYPQMTVFDNIAFPLKARKYKKPMVAYRMKAWDEVVKQIDNPKELILAINEANDKSICFGTKLEYIATKLKISDLASKILSKYRIKSLDSLDDIADEIREKAKAECLKEKSHLEKEGYTINPDFTLTRDGQLCYHNIKLPKEEIRAKVFEAAKILDLGPYLDRRPKELSGGQMQRVALGRAIVRNAKLFLMDEPLSNLDAKLRVQMRSEIVRIHEQIGATTIYVTHDQTEAMTMATKIAVMSKGWVQQVGTPQEIYYNPKNLFVATFIGSPAMNIYNGTYKDGTIEFENGYRIELKDNFKLKHDEFYRNKIADIEAMLKKNDFKKMHAIKLIDEHLFNNKWELSQNVLERRLAELLKLAADFNNDAYEKIKNEIQIFKDSINELSTEVDYAKKINLKGLYTKLLAVIEDIDDSFGEEAVNLIKQELSGAEEFKLDLELYEKYNNTLVEIKNYIERLGAGNRKLLSAIDELNVSDHLPGEAKAKLQSLRRLMLTFDKIESEDIGKLHNAQVFNKDELKSSGNSTMYYEKPHNKKKNNHNNLNLNSVNLEFVNNLYDVAMELLTSSKNALAGSHSIKIGIRPEDIHLANEYREPDKTDLFSCKAEVVELLGSELLVHTTWANTKTIAKIATDNLIKPHNDVELTINSNKVLVFDSLSGDRL